MLRTALFLLPFEMLRTALFLLPFEMLRCWDGYGDDNGFLWGTSSCLLDFSEENNNFGSSLTLSQQRLATRSGYPFVGKYSETTNQMPTLHYPLYIHAFVITGALDTIISGQTICNTNSPIFFLVITHVTPVPIVHLLQEASVQGS
jgi:hypothetical protein